MLLLLYNFLLIPLLFPLLAWRLLVQGKSRAGLGERFGQVPDLGPPPAGGRVWVHAVSVGETVAAAPVVTALREALPGAEILLSTVTPTGQAQARRALPDVALHFYLPFDLPWVTRRVLARLHPSAIVLMEAEIWPNLLSTACRRGVPVVVANGHISDRTLRRGRRLRSLLSPLLASITRYLAQSPAIRDRAVALGLSPGHVSVAGNTKFDQQVPPLAPADAAAIRAALGLAPDQPLLLAGSTHEGEEEQVLEAWETASRRIPNLALMIAPRHLQRVEAIVSLLRQRGLRVELWSDVRPSALGPRPSQSEPNTEHPTPNAERRSTVLLLDTMGDLARFYGLASVAFVGGSLVSKGGHDILQPLFHGVPTLFGPHMQNQRALAELALGAGAARRVRDVAELATTVASLLTEAEEEATMKAAAARLLAENQGASARCAAVVASLLSLAKKGFRQRNGDPEPLGEAATEPAASPAPTAGPALAASCVPASHRVPPGPP